MGKFFKKNLVKDGYIFVCSQSEEVKNGYLWSLVLKILICILLITTWFAKYIVFMHVTADEEGTNQSSDDPDCIWILFIYQYWILTF